MRLRALLFDLDNTLIDRTGAFAGYARRLLQRAGVEEQSRLDHLIALDQGCYRPRSEWSVAAAAALPELGMTPEDLLADFSRSLPEFVPDPARVKEGLARLRGRARLVICTNGSARLQRRKVEAAGLADLIDGLVISGEVGVEKPHSGMFQAALDAAGVLATEALMTGDNPVHDIAGAHDCGIRGAWINRDWTRFVGPLPVGITPDLMFPSTETCLKHLDEILP